MKKLLIIITSFLIIGCTTNWIETSGSEDLTILGKKGTYSISITDIVVDIPNGSYIGNNYKGFFPVKMEEYYWDFGGLLKNNKDVIRFTDKFLNDLGYTVYSIPLNHDDKDNRDEARFQIKAKINELGIDSHNYIIKTKWKTKVNVSWTVLDTESNKIIYELESTGINMNKLPDNPRTIPICIGRALKDSFKFALADENFKTAILNESFQSEEIVQIITKNEDREISLPYDTEEVLDSVVVISNGNSHGSGVFISSDGYILTAAHVVEGTTVVDVTLYNNRTRKAKVVKYLEKKDIALIKISGEGYSPLSFRKEKEKIGRDVYAIGAPHSKDLSYSVTKGILSSYRTYENGNFIQTDARINPGNSGGPLLTQDGQIIGIVSWKIMKEGYEGLAFAVDTRDILGDIGIEILD